MRKNWILPSHYLVGKVTINQMKANDKSKLNFCLFQWIFADFRLVIESVVDTAMLFISVLSLKNPWGVLHSRTVIVQSFSVTSVTIMWSTILFCRRQNSGGGPIEKFDLGTCCSLTLLVWFGHSGGSSSFSLIIFVGCCLLISFLLLLSCLSNDVSPEFDYYKTLKLITILNIFRNCNYTYIIIIGICRIYLITIVDCSITFQFGYFCLCGRLIR